MAIKKQGTEISEHYEVYAEYSKILRTWLVGYGVGVPALILSQKELWEKLAKSESIETIAILFIFGVILQVIISLTNKSIMWASYYGAHNTPFKICNCYKIADTLSKYYWIDLIFDLATIGFYTYATYQCFKSLKI